MIEKNGWSLVYKRAINEDGSLFFKERLTHEFLDQMRRTMGSYMYANQYMNEVIPDDEKRFRPEWIKYYDRPPEITYRFGFIDPAIGQEKHHDYTGIVIVDVDVNGIWYVRVASRTHSTPTEIVSKMFEIHKAYKLQSLGVEIVAYQEALLYMLDQEMKRRGQIIPVTGIKRTATSKNTRILGLVPRFEWGRIYLQKGMTDFEDEYARFPRGSHDDLLDALASLEELVFYPQKPKVNDDNLHPSDPRYESKIIRDLYKNSKQNREEEGSDYV